MALSGAASSDKAEVVRCEATGSDGAMIVLALAKTSWVDELRDKAAWLMESSRDDSTCDCPRQTANIYIVAQ